jgi:hypothetical protein
VKRKTEKHKNENRQQQNDEQQKKAIPMKTVSTIEGHTNGSLNEVRRPVCETGAALRNHVINRR